MKLKAIWFNPLSQSMNLSDPLFSHTSQDSTFSSVRISTTFSVNIETKYASANLLLEDIGPFFPCLTKNSLLCDGYTAVSINLFLTDPQLKNSTIIFLCQYSFNIFKF